MLLTLLSLTVTYSVLAQPKCDVTTLEDCNTREWLYVETAIQQFDDPDFLEDEIEETEKNFRRWELDESMRSYFGNIEKKDWAYRRLDILKKLDKVGLGSDTKDWAERKLDIINKVKTCTHYVGE